MNDDILLKIYNKYNLSSKGSFDAFKTDMQNEGVARKFYDKYGLSSKGDFETFKNDIGVGRSYTYDFDTNKNIPGADKDLGFRNNNPLNLRPVGKGGFRKFNTLEEGYQAAARDLNVKASGKSPAFNSYLSRNNKAFQDASVADLINVWAPPTENSKQALQNYYKVVGQELGIDPFSTHPSKVNTRDLAIAMSKVESPLSYQSLTGAWGGSMPKGTPTQQPATEQPIAASRQDILNGIKQKIDSQYNDFIKKNKDVNVAMVSSFVAPKAKRSFLDEQFQKGVLKVSDFTDKELDYLYRDDKYVEDYRKQSGELKSNLQRQLKDEGGVLESIGDWVGRNAPGIAKAIGFGDVLDTKNGKININVNRQEGFVKSPISQLIKENYLTPQEIMNLKIHPLALEPNNPKDPFNQSLREIQQIIAADEKAAFKADSNGIYKKLELTSKRIKALENNIESKTYKGILKDLSQLNDKLESKTASQEDQEQYNKIVQQLQSTGDLEEYSALAKTNNDANTNLTSLTDKYGTLKKLNFLEDARHVDNEKFRKQLSNSAAFVRDLTDVFKTTVEKLSEIPKDLVQLGGMGIEAGTGIDVNAADSRLKETLFETEKIRTSKQKRSAVDNYVKLTDGKEVVFENGEAVAVYTPDGYQIDDPIQQAKILQHAQLEYEKNPGLLRENKFRWDGVLYGVEETAPDLINMMLIGGAVRSLGTSFLRSAAANTGKVTGVTNALRMGMARAANSPRFLEAMSMAPVFAGQTMDEAIKSGKATSAEDIFIATTAKLAQEMLAESIFAGPIGKALTGKGITKANFDNLTSGKVQELFSRIKTGKVTGKDVGRELLKIGKEFGKDAAFEGFEEAIVEAMNPYVNSFLNHQIDTSFDENIPQASDIFSSFAVGAGAGALMGSGNVVTAPFKMKENVASRYKDLISSITNNSLESKINGEIVKNPDAFKIHAQTLLDKKIVDEETFTRVTNAVNAAAAKSKHLSEPKRFTSKIGKAADTLFGITADDKTEAFNSVYRNVAFDSEMLKLSPEATSANPVISKLANAKLSQYESILEDLNVNHANGLLSAFTPTTLLLSDKKGKYTNEELAKLKKEHESISEQIASTKFSDEVKAQLLELRLRNSLQNIKKENPNLTDKEKEAIENEKAKNNAIENEVLNDESQRIQQQEELDKKQEIVNDLKINGVSSDPNSISIQEERLNQLTRELQLAENADDLLVIEQEYTTPAEREQIQKYKESKDNKRSVEDTKTDAFKKVSFDENFEQSYNDRYSVQNGTVNNQELYNKDIVGVQRAIEEAFLDAFPEGTQENESFKKYLDFFFNSNPSLRDMIDPQSLQQILVVNDPNELVVKNVIAQAIREYFDNKGAGAAPAVIANNQPDTLPDDVTKTDSTRIESVDAIGEKLTSIQDPEISADASSFDADNIMVLGGIEYFKDKGYNAEFYDENNLVVGVVSIDKLDVRDRIFDSEYILNKYNVPGAVSYRIVPDLNKPTVTPDASQTILKLQPSDTIYYELDKNSSYNRNKDVSASNLGIAIVAYVKDGKVVTKDTEGADVKTLGFLPPNKGMNIRELAYEINTNAKFNNKVILGNVPISKVTSRVDHHFNKKRDVLPSEIKADNIFVVEKQFSDITAEIGDGKSYSNFLFKNGDEGNFFNQPIPSYWLGSVIMKMIDPFTGKESFHKFDTKTISEVPDLVTDLDNTLKEFESAVTSGQRSITWFNLLEQVRYRTLASTFDIQSRGVDVAGKKGVGPVINYFADTKLWKLDGVTMESREAVRIELSKRRININPVDFKDKKYISQIHKYLKTDLAESIDSNYRTAPTLYIKNNFVVSPEIIRNSNSLPDRFLDNLVDNSSAGLEKAVPTVQEVAPKEVSNPQSINDLSPSIQEKVKELQNNSSFIKLSTDEKSYINNNEIDPETNKPLELQRTTGVVSDEQFEDTALTQSARTIGTKVDSIGRDVLNDEVRDFQDYDLSDNVELFNKTVAHFSEIRSQLKSRGEFVIPGRIVLYNNDLKIAGEVDVMTVDAKGVFRIYDIKTMKGQKLTPNQYGEISYESNKVFEKTGETKKNGEPKYRIVPGKTQDSTRQKHQKQVSVYSILANTTHRVPVAPGGIMPFEVDYNPGDTKVLDIRPYSIIEVDLIPTISEATNNKIQQVASVEPLSEITSEETQISANNNEEVKKIDKQQEDNKKQNDDLKNRKVSDDVKTRGRKERLKASTKDYTAKETDDKAISWFKERLGEVDIEVNDETISQLYNVFKLGGTKLWGAFHNASVVLASDASSKVTKHEAFHVVFNLFLNDKQREQVLDEAFQRFGKELGITKEQYNLKQQDNLIQLEEKLADLFEDYKDSLSLFTEDNKKKYPNITRFFDKIYKFLFNKYNVLQSYLTDKVTIDSLFYQLENNILGRDFLGRRKKSIRELFSRNVDNVLGKNPFTKLTNEWSSQDITRFARFINKDLLNKYLQDIYGSTSVTVISDTNNISVSDIIKNFRSNIDSVVETYKSELTEDGIAFDNELIDEIVNELKTDKDFERIVLVRLLPDRGIKSTSSKSDSLNDNNLDDGDLETSQNDDDSAPVEHYDAEITLENWQQNEFSVDPLTRMSAKLKEFLSNISITDSEGYTMVSQDTGQIDYYDYEQIHNKLLSELSDSEPATMLQKLNKLREEFDWAKIIIRNIYGRDLYISRKESGTLDLTMEDLYNRDQFEKGDILTSIWNTIADQTNRDFVFIQTTATKTNLVKSNSANKVNELTQKATSYFNNKFKRNGELNYDYTKFDINVATASIKEIKDLLNDLGFAVDNSVITSVLKNNSSQLQALFDNIRYNLSIPLLEIDSKSDNENTKISYKNEEGKQRKTDGNPIFGISALLYKNGLNSEKRNILTLKGKTKYNHGVSNYLNRVIASIKEDPQKFFKSRTEYEGRPILMHSSLEWYSDNLNRNIIEVLYHEGQKEQFAFKGEEYGDMFESGIESLNYNIFASTYDSNKKQAHFTSVVFSDSTVKTSLLQPVYPITSKKGSTIIDKLTNIAFAEIQRINLIKTNIKAGVQTGFYNLDKNGNKFQFLTFLNNAGLNLDRISEEILVTDGNTGLQKLSENAEKKIREEIEKNLENNFTKYVQKLINNGSLNFANGNITKPSTSNIDSNLSLELLRLYYYNQFYYNSTFQLVFGGDLAHYKEKDPNKTVITEAQKRDKQIVAPYSRGLWGKKLTFKSLFLKDIEIPTPSDIINNIIKNFNYNQTEVETILNALSSNNITDAATVHTLARRKEIMKAMDLWKPNKHEAMFERLEKGLATPEDLREILQPLKPFYYGLLPMMDDTSNVSHFVPVQLKNAEMVLLPSVAFLHKDGSVVIPKYDKSTQEKLDFNEYQYPDLAKTLYIMNRNSVDTVLFESAVKASHFKFADFSELNDSVVTQYSSELPNEYWGIQMEVPKKHEDEKVLIGSQIRKIITGDLDPNVVFKYKVDEFTLDKILKDVFNDNANDPDFVEFKSILESQELFSENTLRDLIDMTYELDIKEGLNDTEKFTSDYNKVVDHLRDKSLEKDPSKHVIDSYEIQSDNKTLVPLEISGKKNESYLNSLYKRVSKIKQAGAGLVNMTSLGFVARDGDPNQDQLQIVYSYDQNGNITGIDHIEAAIPANSKIFYAFADKYGNVDVEKIRQFDPSLLDAIFYRIPTEGKYSIFPIKITKILPPNAGGKIILPKEATSIAGLDFDVDKMYGFFKKFKVSINNDLLNDISTSLNNQFNVSFTNEEYSDLINLLISNDIQDDSFLDSIDPKYALVLSTLDYVLKDYENRFGKAKFYKIKSIRSSMATKESRANLRLDAMLQITKSKEFARDFHNVGSKKQLTDIVARLQQDIDPNRSFADPAVQEEIAARNIIGKRLIGIFANANAFHNLIQGRSNLFLEKPFIFNETSYSSFNNTLDKVGNKISKSIAILLFASTEDAKEPVLAALNINPYTAGMITTMLRLGVPLEESLDYIRSPFIKALVKYSNANNTDFTKITSSEKVFNKAISEIAIEESPEILEQFFELANISKDMLNIERAAKVDTGNVGPELSNIIQQLMSIQNTIFDPESRIRGAETVLPSWRINPGTKKYELVRKSPIRQLNAYTSILIQEINQLSKYFNYFTPEFNSLRDQVRELTGSAYLSADKVSLITTEIFNAITQKVLNSSGVDIYNLIYKFPSEFILSDILNQDKYSKLKNAFKIVTDTNGIDVLQLSSKFSKSESEEIRNQIETLILETQSDNKLGTNLAIYSMLLGHKFSSGGFYHLIPPSFYKLTPEGQQIRSIINSNSVNSNEYSNIGRAYEILYNNFTKLVPRVLPKTFKVLKDGSYLLEDGKNRFVYVRTDSGPILLEKVPNSKNNIYYKVNVGLAGSKIKDYVQDKNKARQIFEQINKTREEESLMKYEEIVSLRNSDVTVSNNPDINKNFQDALNQNVIDNRDQSPIQKEKYQVTAEEYLYKTDTLRPDSFIDSMDKPPYTIDRDLKNPDGSIKYGSSTKEGTIFIRPVESLDQFFDYIEGKVDSYTSKQKQIVLQRMSEKGWDIDTLKNFLNTKRLANLFILLHEQDHIVHNDRDVYWANGRSIEDMISEDKIQIETRASINALMQIKAAKDNNLPCDGSPTGIIV